VFGFYLSNSRPGFAQGVCPFSPKRLQVPVLELLFPTSSPFVPLNCPHYPKLMLLLFLASPTQAKAAPRPSFGQKIVSQLYNSDNTRLEIVCLLAIWYRILLGGHFERKELIDRLRGFQLGGETPCFWRALFGNGDSQFQPRGICFFELKNS